MKIQINPQSARVIFTSETVADVRDLGRLSVLLKEPADVSNNVATLECSAGQLLEALLANTRAR